MGTNWNSQKLATQKRNISVGDEWPDELLIDNLDPGLPYQFKVKAKCSDAEGQKITEKKEYGLTVAPGYIPQQPSAYLTGNNTVVKFHILPNTMCDDFMLQYKVKGKDEWTEQRVSNNFPGTSDRHSDFWMYEVDNADPKYRWAQVQCLFDNTGTDIDPEYKMTKVMDTIIIKY